MPDEALALLILVLVGLSSYAVYVIEGEAPFLVFACFVFVLAILVLLYTVGVRAREWYRRRNVIVV